MGNVVAGVLGIILAAAGAYLLCRNLSCAPLPAGLGAAAWAFSRPLLAPGSSSAGLAGIESSCLVPFALAGAFSRERRRWPFLVFALVCALGRWREDAAAAGGTSVLEALVLAVLAALGAQRLHDAEGGAAFMVGAAAAMALGLGLAGRGASHPWLEAAPAAAALTVAAASSREYRARAGLVALVALFATQRALEIVVRGHGPRSGVAEATARP